LFFFGLFRGLKKKRAIVDEKKKSSVKIIKSRFNMIAEGIIPQGEFESLKERDVKIFLTEPDPKKWPPELSHLKKYVPEDTVA
jgi:hypothetical protein